MLDQLWANAILTFRAPRRGARFAIDRFDTLERVALIFALAFAANALLMSVRGVLTGEDLSGEMGPIGFLVGNLFASLVAFTLMVVMILVIGRLFGGRANLMEVSAALAWHSLVTAAFAPFINPVALMTEAQGPGFIISLLLIGVTLWLLVNFIAEAHGFRSAWRVAAVMFGGLFLLGALVPFFLAGTISGA